MPFRTQETLEHWLDDFSAAGRELPGAVSVLQQDGSDGADTGLIVIELANAPTQLYLEPVGPGDPRWAITFLPRDSDAVRSGCEVAALGEELGIVAEFCHHLEERSATQAAELDPSAVRGFSGFGAGR